MKAKALERQERKGGKREKGWEEATLTRLVVLQPNKDAMLNRTPHARCGGGAREREKR